MGPLFALDRVGPKCIDFATCFGLSRSVMKHQLTKEKRCIGLLTFHRFEMVNIILIFPLFLSFSNDCEHYGGAFEVKWFLVATCVLLTADRRSLPLPVNVERPPLAMENPKNVFWDQCQRNKGFVTIALSRRAVFDFCEFIQSHFYLCFPRLFLVLLQSRQCSIVQSRSLSPCWEDQSFVCAFWLTSSSVPYFAPFPRLCTVFLDIMWQHCLV